MASMKINKAVVMQSLKQEDFKVRDRIRMRQKLLTNRVESMNNKKIEIILELTDALEDADMRCDTVQKYVQDFQNDRTQVKKFECQLTNILNLFEEQQVNEPALSDSSEEDPLTLYEIKTLYAKVLSKVESLQNSAKNVVEDKNTSTASPRPKKTKQNKAALQALSEKLDNVISKLNGMLEMAKQVMDIVLNIQNEQGDLVTKVRVADIKDYKLISENHAIINNMVDKMQRTVYDKTVPFLTASQLARISLERPSETPNTLDLFCSFDDIDGSAKKIEKRLEKIEMFCKDSLNDQMYTAMAILWSEAGPNQRLFPDILAAMAAGPSQGSQSQGSQPQGSQPQRSQPQASESQGGQPQAGEPQQAPNSTGSVLDS